MEKHEFHSITVTSVAENPRLGFTTSRLTTYYDIHCCLFYFVILYVQSQTGRLIIYVPRQWHDKCLFS